MENNRRKLEELSDEELCELSQNGDERAKELLIVRSEVLVKTATHAFYIIGGDRDDLMQEGRIGLIKAIDGYREGKSSFKSFATLCVKRYVISAIKRSATEKRKTQFTTVSLTREDGIDEVGITADERVINPEADLINKEAEAELNNKFRGVLSDLEYKIMVLYYVSGYSYAEIGEATGKTYKSIDNALQRIKKKLEATID